MRYNLRALILATTFIACAFGVISLLNWLYAVDAGSEIVQVNGKTIELQWIPEQWQKGHSGVWGDHGYLTSATPLIFDDGQIEFEQTLFSLSYKNHLGAPTYNAKVYVDGIHDGSWRNFSMLVNHVGGGNVDAGLTCQHEFDEEAKLLTLHITKWHNSLRSAQKCSISFVHNGESFAPQE